VIIVKRSWSRLPLYTNAGTSYCHYHKYLASTWNLWTLCEVGEQDLWCPSKLL